MPDIIDSLIPINTIIKWSGTIASIPQGWQLCDGTNGTPDLRARFIRGAPAGNNPGTTGGADSVTLTTAQIPAHNHSVTDPKHQHSLAAQHGGSAGGSYQDGSGTSSLNYVSTGITIGNTGCGTSHENRPAYYEVAFIIKIIDN